MSKEKNIFLYKLYCFCLLGKTLANKFRFLFWYVKKILFFQNFIPIQSSPQRRLVFFEGVFSVQNPKVPVDIGTLWLVLRLLEALLRVLQHVLRAIKQWSDTSKQWNQWRFLVHKMTRSGVLIWRKRRKKMSRYGILYYRFFGHSSEIKGLRLTKCSSEMLQNLLYFMYKKIHVAFFISCNFMIFIMNVLVYVHRPGARAL